MNFEKSPKQLFLERLNDAIRIAVLEAENKRLRARIVELENYEAPVNLSNMNIKALKQEAEGK